MVKASPMCLGVSLEPRCSAKTVKNSDTDMMRRGSKSRHRTDRPNLLLSAVVVVGGITLRLLDPREQFESALDGIAARAGNG